MANGIGASTAMAASVSTPARATRSPSGRRWCHEIGCATRRTTTLLPSVPAIRHCVLPAHVRRTTTPTPRSRPMPMISATPVDDRARGHRAVVEAGHDDVVDHPLHGDARRHRAQGEHGGAGDGDGERARVQADLGGDHADALAGAVEPPRRASCSHGRGSIGAGPGPRHGFGPLPGPLGRVPCVDPIDLALLVLRVVFGLFLAAHGYNKVFGGGKLAGTGRLVRLARHAAGHRCRPASPPGPRSAPGCCSPSGCSPRSPPPG